MPKFAKLSAAALAMMMLATACGDDDEKKDASDAPAADVSDATDDSSTTDTDSDAEVGNIVEVASDAGSFETLLTAATAAGLAETLSGEGPFTVFAPTDEAFAALPEGALDDLLADPEALKNVLLYHVVQGSEVKAADVVELTEAEMANGGTVSITVTDGKVMLNDSVTVTSTDIAASNGVIHVIDTVLLPPSE